MQHAQLFTMSIFVTFISNNTITEALIYFFIKHGKITYMMNKLKNNTVCFCAFNLSKYSRSLAKKVK